jgi:hypothetical protein
MITPTVPLRAVTPTAPSKGARDTGRTWRGRPPAAASDAIWVPSVSAMLILAAGAVSLATGQPALFVALGPTALIVASSPGHPTTRFHSIVLGHLTAFLCGWVAVLLMGAGAAPAIFAGQALPVVRVWASAFAVGLTALVQPTLRAYHPPAAATALLVTLGAYKLTWKASLGMMAGVLVVALVGEWLQRLRIREQRGTTGVRA